MFEQRRGVVRARAGLRMTLEAECRLVRALHPLQASIEQGLVSNPQVVRQTRFVNREAVVLAGDQYSAVIDVLHRMVGAVMAKLHFYRRGATGQAQQLVPQANSEHRDICFEKRLNSVNRIGAGLRITRAVGQENAVRFHGQNFSSGGLRRHHGQATAVIDQHSQDVALDPVVEGDDVVLRVTLRAVALGQRPFGLGPFVGSFAGRYLREDSKRALSRFTLSGQLLSGANRWVPLPAPPRPSEIL